MIFKKDRITLESGNCQKEGTKWICIIPNKRIKEFQNITYQLRQQEFAKSVVLNNDASNSNVRVVITLKQGYRFSFNKKLNGKEVLVFSKK